MTPRRILFAVRDAEESFFFGIVVTYFDEMVGGLFRTTRDTAGFYLVPRH